MTRARVFTVLRIALALLVVTAVALAVAHNWAEVSEDIDRIDGGTFALAALLVCIPPILTMLGWRVLLADLGTPLHVAPAGGVFFVGQLGKYLPGAVWSIVAQAEMGARLEIPRRRSAVVAFVSVALAAICGLIVGLPALPLLLGLGGGAATTGWFLLLVVPLLAVVLYPRLLNWGIALVLRVLRREPLEHTLSGRAVLTSSALFIGAWLASGSHVLVLARATSSGYDGGRLVLGTLSGFALASSLAMFSVLLPAGVGVREGLLVLILGPVTSTSAATAVVVISRFLTVMADVVFALLGWAYARSHHLLTSREERVAEHVVVPEDRER
ncbi:lysylphosphatidylglycerol synthase domain-containing protein [Phycicoccus sp. M110.8]|uniref:lysylphosphatidylglycerol synthase domain-containing protein n=1 Tax=Phycicoccus sp. M110.8 TaxID=3075433 RepID=UPI0028FDB355|nr:lysylphosphatidylglycerol synthase domain-containing protein [Phycicoccus sp. M110.8]MDU0312693.1 lysylphosphatidylglycerol synthase domain-containing protein [Phycicoccus sp. M110.8]